MIRYGVIGPGDKERIKHVVRAHVAHCRFNSFMLSALYDPLPENRALISETVVSPPVVCVSPEELITTPAVEAVLIASPDEQHPAHLLAAVKAGKHVFVDKPLAVDRPGMALVQEALTIATEKRLVVSTCSGRRFDPAHLYMKQVVQSNARADPGYGRLISVHIDFSFQRPESTVFLSRNLLIDHLPQKLDFLAGLLDPCPFRAVCLVHEPLRYSVAGTRADGVSFLFSGTRLLKNSPNPQEIALRFERGAARLCTKTGILTRHDHDTSVFSTRVGERISDDLRYPALMQHFSQAVQGHTKYDFSRHEFATSMAAAIDLATLGVYTP